MHFWKLYWNKKLVKFPFTDFFFVSQKVLWRPLRPLNLFMHHKEVWKWKFNLTFALLPFFNEKTGLVTRVLRQEWRESVIFHVWRGYFQQFYGVGKVKVCYFNKKFRGESYYPQIPLKKNIMLVFCFLVTFFKVKYLSLANLAVANLVRCGYSLLLGVREIPVISQILLFVLDYKWSYNPLT